MALRMGLREANQQFSRAIRAVKAGQDVVLTERGRPVAVIKPLSRRRAPGPLERLEAAGLLRGAAVRGTLRRWTPRQVRGRPISETLRDEREAD